MAPRPVVLLLDEADVVSGPALVNLDTSSDDYEYVIDLGLVKKGPLGVEIANNLPEPWWPWLLPDGGLDFGALIDAFIAWWRANADMLYETEQVPYREAAAHLAFRASSSDW